MSRATTTAAPVELSAWMRRRLAGIVAKATPRHDADPDALVVCALTFHAVPGSDDDFRCDRCKTMHRSGLYLFRLALRPWLVVTGGLCDACAAAEGWCR